jgi:deoxyribodipyrimidine photolyase-related protein
MERFYRHVRSRRKILMEGDKPAGGRFSFDRENRHPWKGEPEPPDPPRFRPDAVTREVGDLVEAAFSDHPGHLDLGALPATRRAARRMWTWAKAHCLASFGPFEDAMSRRHRGLFHTRMAALVNLHRVLPHTLVSDVEALDVPLPSKEGFIRQVLGWREFVRHVHRETDGFRLVAGPRDSEEDVPASPSFLGAEAALPDAYWGTPSGLTCLDGVVADVWAEGWSHHIPRLMVLANIATLLDVSPRELTDWFWVAYVDAYDWVVEPNVLGMGTFAAGDVLTTKPYVSGAPYIHRMGDYCDTCAFDPKADCPITPLYWAFLGRHAAALAGNPRLNMPYASLRKRSPDRRALDAAIFEHVRATLEAGDALAPGALPS